MLYLSIFNPGFIKMYLSRSEHMKTTYPGRVWFHALSIHVVVHSRNLSIRMLQRRGLCRDVNSSYQGYYEDRIPYYGSLQPRIPVLIFLFGQLSITIIY